MASIEFKNTKNGAIRSFDDVSTIKIHDGQQTIDEFDVKSVIFDYKNGQTFEILSNNETSIVSLGKDWMPYRGFD